jgi:hypothetical protein
MKELFIILAKESDYVINCVNSVKKFHPLSDILIIDSDSNDKSYFKHVESNVSYIADIKNKHFMDGAIWHTYKNYSNFTNYIFLQDSTEILKNIEFAFNENVYSIQYFYDTIDISRDSLILPLLKKYTNLDLPANITGMFGPMMACPREFLDNAINIRMDMVLPTNKVSSMSMERVWGYIASHFNYDIVKNTFEGVHRGQSYNDYKYIYKKYPGRT